MKIESVDNKRHLETFGPFAGLWVRTANALRKAGYTSPEKVREDIESGALRPFLSIFDYGKYADREVRAWLGLPTKKEKINIRAVDVSG